MSDRGGGGEFVVGFFIGALVGGVAALLLAPQSGEETRRQIQDTGIQLRDRAVDFTAEARQRAEELQERGRIVLEEQRSKIEHAVAEGKSAAAKKREDLLGKLEPEEAEA